MTITVEFDGTNHEFPDDFTDADIQKALAATPAPSSAAPPSAAEKFAMGAGDVPKGIGQSFAHAPPVDPYSSMSDEFDTRGQAATLGPAADASLAGREKDWQGQRAASGDKGIEWARAGGQMLASSPMALFGGGAPSVMGAIGRGIALGAANTGLQPVTEGDYNSGKMGQLASGAATGAAFSGGGAVGKRLLNPNPSAEVRLLQSKGVAPTIGQLLGGAGKKTEDKLTSVPGLGDAIMVGQGRAVDDFNRAAFQTALDPIGAKFEGAAGREGLGRVRDAISSAYDDVLPNVAFKADGQFTSDLQNASREVAFAQPAIQEQFHNIVKNEILPRVNADGTMSGEAFKKLESELTKQISKWTPQGGDTASLADGVDGVLTAFRNNLVRNNPEYGDKLQAANAAWSRFADLRRAVANTRNPDGVFTPDVLWTALKAGDRSAGKGKTAMLEGGDLQQLASAGLKVLGNKYPDSGTPGRAAMGALFTGGPAMIAAASHNPFLAAPAAAAGIGMVPYLSGTVQRGISSLLSARGGQKLSLLGGALDNVAPLLSGEGAVMVPSLLGRRSTAQPGYETQYR